ncbi:hypothetical protein EII25_03510 [Erysipelotrichaceae bacterium OH741_COT-311]|nr:hypothetical protein EII25_03510 [Erysipelotrichaceae bacterium OH741_COT-311]
MFKKKIDISKLTDYELKERIEILKNSLQNFKKDDPVLPFFQAHLKKHQEEMNKRNSLFN